MEIKRIINILIGFILVITLLSLSLSAGDENNPEIKDPENDIIGPLIKHPILYKILQSIGKIPVQSFDFMDIKSAWFYESDNEPNYLFASIKIKNLDYIPLRAIYAIHWTFNDKNYGASCHTHSNGIFKWFAAGQIFGLLDNWAYKKGLIVDLTDCIIDDENNLLTLKIPKNIIGNPNPGDILTYTNAWTGLRFISEVLTYPLGGELATDQTSYGNYYIIKY